MKAKYVNMEDEELFAKAKKKNKFCDINATRVLLNDDLRGRVFGQDVVKSKIGVAVGESKREEATDDDESSEEEVET